MTRKEKLEQAADKYAEKHGFRVPYDGSNDFYDEVDVTVFEKVLKESLLSWSNPDEITLDDDFVREQAKQLFPIAYYEGRQDLLKDLRKLITDVERAGGTFTNLKTMFKEFCSLVRKVELEDIYSE